MATEFRTLPLKPELIQALDAMAYVQQTPIQAAALPPMLEGQDVIGQAKTGSGKTAAFGLALLSAIDPAQAKTQGLVICPTRELAEQVATELRRLAQRMANTRIITACGGQPSRDQSKALLAGCHVVVGTPGRLAWHQRNNKLRLEGLRVLVLDEADRMLDMGFADQVMEIVKCCPRQRQTLLFSATFPDQIAALSKGVQDHPLRVQVQAQVQPELLRQLIFVCERDQRQQMVADLLAEYRPSTALIFCETRANCNDLAAFLRDQGAVALALHGDLEQRDRDDILLQFSNGSASILVATNVAARGLDIPDLPLVIVSELSPDPDSHIHRIGRTGRAGQAGLALSIVASTREQRRLDQVQQALGLTIEAGPTPPSQQRHPDSLAFLSPPFATLLIMSGRRDKLRPGDVLGALVKDAGIPADAIGKITMSARTCAVAVKREQVEAARRYLCTGRIKKKRVRVALLG